ncbi:hypothetical protein BU17DRAFT_47025 [Hysterangium stoloniferum]|nr:hypothetical protein BU17DRAFT_47025 [Hysterangium stoloniferum]
MFSQLFLSQIPPLTTNLNPYPVAPLESLRHSRERYVLLLKEKMRAPDGSYEEGFQVPGSSKQIYESPPKKPDNWNLNNPLSLDSSNPWHAYFSAIDSRNMIRQDVERTFPEIPYFRQVSAQNEMTNILFIHTDERQDVGYRQGMHELLACIYRAVDFDSLEYGQIPSKPDLEELCDRTYVVADAWALFHAVMLHMESWYEWRAPVTTQVSPISPNTPHFLANGDRAPHLLANGQLELDPYVAPIVLACASLKDDKLRYVDPHLWEKLNEGGVEPQMYGIRWLRLLFTREFSLAESMVIWDALFASVSNGAPSSSKVSSGQGFELAIWICVAMLIRIRNHLIPGDYNTHLTYLLRYPSPSSLGSPQTSNAPALLLSQAQSLIASPTPSTGAALMIQNRNELGIRTEVPEAPRKPPRRWRASATAPSTVSQSKASQIHERPRLQDVITNRLMDANESLGIQRGIYNTISEIRKNLPDLQQTLIRNASWNGPLISLADERVDWSSSGRNLPQRVSDTDERPPWEPRTRSDIEGEIAELRGLFKTLGGAVSWAVDVLLLDEDDANKTPQTEKTLKERKREAIECMAYVRDVLARGGKGEIEEERLVSEEEYKRRRLQASSSKEVDAPQPPKPVMHLPRASVSHITTELSPPSQGSLSTNEATIAPPISPLARIPISHPLASAAPPDLPLSPFSRGGSRIAPPLETAEPPRKVIPPWEHTPSNFSGEPRFALPRIPPPSGTAPARNTSDHHIARGSPVIAMATPEPPQSDPLGVRVLH